MAGRCSSQMGRFSGKEFIKFKASEAQCTAHISSLFFSNNELEHIRDRSTLVLYLAFLGSQLLHSCLSPLESNTLGIPMVILVPPIPLYFQLREPPPPPLFTVLCSVTWPLNGRGKVTSSLTAIESPGLLAHNCKMAYFGIPKCCPWYHFQCFLWCLRCIIILWSSLSLTILIAFNQWVNSASHCVVFRLCPCACGFRLCPYPGCLSQGLSLRGLGAVVFSIFCNNKFEIWKKNKQQQWQTSCNTRCSFYFCSNNIFTAFVINNLKYSCMCHL